MTEWIEYTGSDDQIAEIEAAFQQNGFIVSKENGGISGIIQGSQPLAKGFVPHNFNTVWRVKKYLVCNPHPHAAMARQQLLTGQPVWIRINRSMELKEITGMGWCQIETRSNYTIIKTNLPNWNLKAEYSFTPFKGEV